MLPLRGLRVAVSKSNSSSRVPSTTTTRVSSGWLASMSMRLAMGSLRGVGSLPARATGGQAASLGRGGRCAIDPSNGQTLAKTGKHRIAGPQLGPADLGFPIATACLTVLPQTRRAQILWGRQPGPVRRLPSERSSLTEESASNDGDCSRDATYGVRLRATIKTLRHMSISL